MAETVHTFCRICETLCGLEVEVDGGRVVRIRPDRQHVTTEGHACAKGLYQHELYDSPDRLRHPLKREGGRFVEVPWKQALAEIGAKLRRLRRDHGGDSIAAYIGTAAGFSFLHPIFAQGLLTGLGSRSAYAPASQDCSNKFAVARMVYGYPFLQPFPDIDSVECLVVVGSNPAMSKWSFLQVARPLARFRDIVARGGRLVFVDPRRTESARAAGEHLFIRPGTDLFFYLSFLQELIASGGVDRGRVARFMTGFDEVERVTAPWTPERTEKVTRIPAEVLRDLVRSYREATGAALYCSTGVNMGPHGSAAYWLQEVINAASGNLDRRGGTLVGRGAVDFPGLGKRHGVMTRRDRSRVGGLPSVNDAFPGGVLADEILTPGAGQVRALLCTGGNPLITMPNAGRLAEAFEALELLVVVDIFRNETAELADYVLPATSPLERPDLLFSFPFLLGIQNVPYLQATTAAVPPAGESWEEPRIFAEIAQAAGAPLFGAWPLQLALVAAARRGVGSERLLSAVLRAAGAGSWGELLARPHGLLRPGHQPGDFLGQRVLTDDGLVDLAPPPLVDEARHFEEAFESEARDEGGLRLVGRRTLRTHNSWTHNTERFLRHEGSTNHLHLNPADGAARDLGEGDVADVTTATATVRVPVHITDEVMPGTVALAHGWGHQHAAGLSVARRATGVNVNLLAPDGPDSLEQLSGMARLTAIPVGVTKATGEKDDSSWSGRASSRLRT